MLYTYELLILTTAPQGSHCYHLHFTVEETEAQEGKITCPKPYSSEETAEIQSQVAA